MEIPTSEDLKRLTELAKIIVASGLYRRKLETVSQALALMLIGMDWGLSPLSSLSQIHILAGSPSLSAGAQAAIAKRGGKYTWRVERIDDTACELVFLQRSGEAWIELGPASFSVEDAKRAGLNSQNWHKFRQDMLFARALSRGVRRYCADQFGGTVYTEGELDEDPAPPSRPEPEEEPINIEAGAQWAVNVEAYDTIEEATSALEDLVKTNATTKAKRQAWRSMCQGRASERRVEVRS